MLITHSVEEAIYLASRIVVVTAIVALRSDIRELVMSEYRAQQALALPASFRNNHPTT